MVLPGLVYQQDLRKAVAHFGKIVQSTSLPIMIYKNPVTCNADLWPGYFSELARDENIVAVQASSHDSRPSTDMVDVCGDR
jgi:dihydrodipicolinate synthase/N-acetylneuraminate lyase